MDERLQTLQAKAHVILQDMEYQQRKQTAYKREHEKLSSNYVLFVSVQILVFIGSVVWQILTLRNFFVKKNIVWM